jgi:branched-chain amino acid aminotransferase
MFPNTHFAKASKYWYQGKIYDWSEAVVHPMAHALHYGTSVFEGIRAYATDRGPAVFRLTEHIDRLLVSAEVCRMDHAYGRDEIIDIVKLVMRENAMQSAYIRPLFFYSYGNLGLYPKFCPVDLLVGTWEWGAYLGDKAEKGVSVCVIPQRRVHRSQLDMRAKLGGVYVQSTICGIDARKAGFDEAVFLNMEGRVAEGPGENIFLVKDGVFHTNDGTESILEGITRTSILKILGDLGHKTRIAPFTIEDLVTADEVFFTGTAVEVTPVVKITDTSTPGAPAREFTIGEGTPGPRTLEVSRVYKEVVTGKRPEYENWLTYIDA